MPLSKYYLTVVYIDPTASHVDPITGAHIPYETRQKVKAESEHHARRILLNKYLKLGWQVKEIISDSCEA